MLEKSKIVKLDGVALYAPSTCKSQTLPVHSQDSGTDVLEDMHIRVLGFRRKVVLTWQVLTGEQLAEMLGSMIRPTNYYQLTYKDPLLGVHSIEVYIPDYQLDVYSYKVNEASDGVYRDVSIEFIGRKLTQT